MPKVTQFGTVSRDVTASTNIDCTWNGSTGMFAVIGTFNSTTIKLQHKIADSWIDIGPDATFTSNGQTLFTTSSKKLRVNLSGAPTNVDIIVETVSENKA